MKVAEIEVPPYMHGRGVLTQRTVNMLETERNIVLLLQLISIQY